MSHNLPPKGWSERMASIETKIDGIDIFIKEIKSNVMWKDTCEQKHKTVDAQVCHVKKKSIENESDIKDMKNNIDKDKKFAVTLLVSFIATAIAIGSLAFALVGG